MDVHPDMARYAAMAGFDAAYPVLTDRLGALMAERPDLAALLPALDHILSAELPPAISDGTH
jgi:hypothetical protein